MSVRIRLRHARGNTTPLLKWLPLGSRTGPCPIVWVWVYSTCTKLLGFLDTCSARGHGRAEVSSGAPRPCYHRTVEGAVGPAPKAVRFS